MNWGDSLKRWHPLPKPHLVWVSILVLIAILTFVRLGFWQLDRLAARRVNNAQVKAHSALPVLDLNQASLPLRPSDLQYRNAIVKGTFDPAGAVALGSEARNGQVGVHLLVPLVLDGAQQAILVDRGWIPATELNVAAWQRYNQPGVVTVRGMILLPQDSSAANLPTGHARIMHVNSVHLSVLSSQVAEPLLPVYLQAAPEVGAGAAPYAELPQIDLSEGPHLSYALQWFAFATILAVGFPVVLYKSLQRG
ncbi:MAG: SURF1 family protein [Anaerolineaceae bacterium]|nr:SURF1 family protein [Anaerolineaceae bacterium]